MRIVLNIIPSFLSLICFSLASYDAHSIDLTKETSIEELEITLKEKNDRYNEAKQKTTRYKNFLNDSSIEQKTYPEQQQRKSHENFFIESEILFHKG
ncbi:hypothetical protein [Candidatus Liberibacter sp.]|uniref:hypothetical protein n=1 Tax=Candidatus Liberibacter sp. TaxID=34022 RepID=UPI0015F3B07B|nr:hypothetical protein [Candidatus Liberibacter sp.]MBA5723721.1 hypothetical protein [Candidatus Liberibacter sp.]